MRSPGSADLAWYGAWAMVSNGAPLADVTDAELARQVAIGGARPAEAELCRRFAPRIRLYGLRHLRNDDAARDLVQAVLIAVLEAMRAGRVEDPDRIDRFVLGTCRHLALRARHADRRTQPSELDELGAIAVPLLDALDVEALFRCMTRLDARARSVLYLAFYRDRSAGEIAEALASTAGNVRVIRHRAMAELRHCLEAAEVAR